MIKSIVCLPLLGALATLAFAQKPVISAVDNGASFTSHLSPGLLATVFGSNLSGSSLEVKIGGMQCPITFSSATQINIQIPWETTVGRSRVVVQHDGLSSAPFAVTISKYSPALVSNNGSGSGLGDFSSGSKVISTTNPANAGDVLVTFAIGLGATNPAATTGVVTPNPPPFFETLATPSIKVGKKSAKVLFSGLTPGSLAIDQLNFTLAPNTPAGTDTVTLAVGTASDSQINIPIGCLDVTAAGVTVTKGPLTNPSTGKYVQKVTLQNTSGKRIQPKGSLVLTALTSSAQLTNGGGASCPSSDGSPYKSFTFEGTGAAQTATVTLDFTDTTTGSITYGQRVLAK